jgi:hypothetical protein
VFEAPESGRSSDAVNNGDDQENEIRDTKRD